MLPIIVCSVCRWTYLTVTEKWHVKCFYRFSGFDKWCTERIDIALFLWDFLIVPGHIYVLDGEQTVTRPALSGNNIRFQPSGRHFSDKEIPPLIKYVRKKIHLHVFFCLSLGKETGTVKKKKKRSQIQQLFCLNLSLKQLVFIYSIITSV